MGSSWCFYKKIQDDLRGLNTIPCKGCTIVTNSTDKTCAARSLDTSLGQNVSDASQIASLQSVPYRGLWAVEDLVAGTVSFGSHGTRWPYRTALEYHSVFFRSHLAKPYLLHGHTVKARYAGGQSDACSGDLTTLQTLPGSTPDARRTRAKRFQILEADLLWLQHFCWFACCKGWGCWPLEQRLKASPA